MYTEHIISTFNLVTKHNIEPLTTASQTSNVSVSLNKRPASLLRLSFTVPQESVLCVHELYFDSGV